MCCSNYLSDLKRSKVEMIEYKKRASWSPLVKWNWATINGIKVFMFDEEDPCQLSWCSSLAMRGCFDSSKGMSSCNRAVKSHRAKFLQWECGGCGKFGRVDQYQSHLGTMVCVLPFQRRCNRWTRCRQDMNSVAILWGLQECDTTMWRFRECNYELGCQMSDQDQSQLPWWFRPCWLESRCKTRRRWQKSMTAVIWKR